MDLSACLCDRVVDNTGEVGGARGARGGRMGWWGGSGRRQYSVGCGRVRRTKSDY